MTSNKHRNGTIAIEYVLVLLLVIGLSTTLIEFRGTLENTSTNVENTITATNTRTNQASDTEATTNKTNTNNSSNTSSSETSVTKLYTLDDTGNKTTILDYVDGLKISLDTSNTYLSTISTNTSKLPNTNNTLATTNTKHNRKQSNKQHQQQRNNRLLKRKTFSDYMTSTYDDSTSCTISITIDKSGTYLVTLGVRTVEVHASASKYDGVLTFSPHVLTADGLGEAEQEFYYYFDASKTHTATLPRTETGLGVYGTINLVRTGD